MVYCTSAASASSCSLVQRDCTILHVLLHVTVLQIRASQSLARPELQLYPIRNSNYRMCGLS